MKLKFFSLILASLTLISLCPSVNAQDAYGEQDILECEVYSSGNIDDDTPSEELFAAYANNKFYSEAPATYARSASAGSRLSETDRKLYDLLKTEIQKMADGKSAKTTVEISNATLTSWGAKTTWTNTELSVNYITDLTTVAKAFRNNFDLDNILSALLADCPYELYWFDKTQGFGSTCSMSYIGQSQNRITSATIAKVKFYFIVCEAYQANTADEKDISLNTQKTGATINAVNNAKAIIEQYSESEDYDKLKAYKDKICSLVSYNNSAASDDSFPYGDPWQLIYVFDNNTSTNVVCEGYSKAFQYLCDLSSFSSDIYCYTVTGNTSGNHMWNIVTMDDGKNYICDVTNSDTGTTGSNGSLFLVGANGSINAGYRVSSTTYRYDQATTSLWGTASDSILAIASRSYAPSPSPITITTAQSIVYDGNQVTAGTSEADIVYSIDIDGYSLSHTFTKKDDKSNTSVTPKDAGEYTITVVAQKQGSTRTYKKSKSFTIEKATLTITPEPIRIEYGQTPPTVTKTDIVGFVENETLEHSDITGSLSVIHEYVAFQDVGKYEFTTSGYTSHNYDLIYIKSTLTVLPKEIDVQWLNIENRYFNDGKTAAAVPLNILEGDDVSVAVNEIADEEGEYTARATLTGEDASNYIISEMTQTIKYMVSRSTDDQPDNDQQAQSDTQQAPSDSASVATSAEINLPRVGCLSSINAFIPITVALVSVMFLIKRKRT
ncbi:MAG: hypothetical protein J6U86_05915 [Clostridia bacterium]|nr:hypothetical protein [Clostridia bacterium]